MRRTHTRHRDAFALQYEHYNATKYSSVNCLAMIFLGRDQAVCRVNSRWWSRLQVSGWRRKAADIPGLDRALSTVTGYLGFTRIYTESTSLLLSITKAHSSHQRHPHETSWRPQQSPPNQPPSQQHPPP